MIPNLWNAFRTAMRTAWAWARRYEILADEEDARKRLIHCEFCSALSRSRQCDVCTCFVDAKVLLNPEECPVGKWPAVWRKKLTKPGSTGT
jgi:hypothetical protein